MADAAIELNDRITRALGGHDMPWETKDAILDGYAAAGGPQATWKDLPSELKAKIEEVEAYPPTSWDDPADVPPGEWDDDF